MGNGEDNVWSLLKDMMPLLIVFAFMILVFVIAAQLPSPEPPRWQQNRYFRWFLIAFRTLVIGWGLFKAAQAWRLF